MKYMSQLDEKSKRRFLATKAIPLGCHGVTWVAEASGVNRDTIYKGIHELKADEQIPKGRVRKPGGGSKRLLDKNPVLLEVFDDIVEAHTAGLPQDDSVRWVSLTTPQIREIFKERGIDISDYHVRQMVAVRGFKKRSFVKSKTLKDDKDRDAQFQKINTLTEQCLKGTISSRWFDMQFHPNLFFNRYIIFFLDVLTSTVFRYRCLLVSDVQESHSCYSRKSVRCSMQVINGRICFILTLRTHALKVFRLRISI